MKLKTYKPLTFFLLLFLWLAPGIIFAQTNSNGLIPDCGADCGFDHLLQLAKNIMNFIFIISIPISVISFAWAGFIYITAGGNESKISKAHSIFVKVGVGFILVVAAWLIVWTITSLLLNPNYIYLG